MSYEPDYRQFADLPGGTLSISEAGEVIYTPKQGVEKRLKRTYYYIGGGYRAEVTCEGQKFDLLNVLKEQFRPTESGFAVSRHGEKTVCNLGVLMIVPQRPVLIDCDDVYYAAAEDGEILAAAERLRDFGEAVADVVKYTAKQYIVSAVKKYFDTSTSFDQPIDGIFLGLKCTDEDKPQRYYDIDKRLIPFLRSYDKTQAAGRAAIRSLIEAAPVYEWRVYLRWIYTMRSDHYETARAMDICPNVLKYSIRRSALTWASEEFKRRPDLFNLIF